MTSRRMRSDMSTPGCLKAATWCTRRYQAWQWEILSRIHGCRPIGDVPNTEEFPLPAARWPGYNCRTGLPAKQRFGSASHQILKQARASFDRTFCWNSQAAYVLLESDWNQLWDRVFLGKPNRILRLDPPKKNQGHVVNRRPNHQPNPAGLIPTPFALTGIATTTGWISRSGGAGMSWFNLKMLRCSPHSE